jgi:hypothetical protein
METIQTRQKAKAVDKMGGSIPDAPCQAVWGKLVSSGETYEEQNWEADKRAMEEQAGPDY